MLVGRDTETARLTERLADSQPCAVVLYGEAGVGKTALLTHVLADCPRTRYVGGGLATLAWIPLLPIRRALGARLDPDVDGDPTFLADLVGDLVGDGVLVVDDLHWADQTTTALLPLLAGRIRVLAAVRRGDRAAPEVLDSVRGAGFDTVEVDPLPARYATELAMRIRADLAPQAVRAVVRNSGGNPLLIEELAGTETPSESLRLALAARLRSLPEAAGESMALLALAGHGLPGATLGPALGSLVEAGLVQSTGHGYAIRHALLGEVALAMRPDTEHRALHARLAGLVTSPGEAARHHLAAGDRQAAFQAAMRAVEQAGTPGERATHLGLAAACADGPDATGLRIRAGEELAATAQYGAAEEVLRDLPEIPEIQARAAAVRVRTRWELGDPAGSERAVDDGLRWCAGSGSAAELALLLEQARVLMFVHNDPARALPLARRALPRARQLRVHEARALYLAGTLEYILKEHGWEGHLSAAMRMARVDGDIDVECRAANNLVTAHESLGIPARGLRIGTEMIERTRALRLVEWSRQFHALVLNLGMNSADYSTVIDGATALLGETLEVRTRQQVLVTLAIALADVGRAREALNLLDTGFTGAAGDRYGLGSLHEGRAVVLLAAGLPAATLAEAGPLLDSAQGDPDWLAVIAPEFAWAALRCGREPPDLGDLGHLVGMLSAVPHELAGVAALRAERPRPALDQFDAAADAWAAYYRRGELRCQWAAGEALVRAGRLDQARQRLLAVEERARAHGMLPLLAHIARSLRRAGVRRPAPVPAAVSAAGSAADRPRSGPLSLTAREREAVLLAGQGLSDEAIGIRLGVSARTVETHLTAARRKLGARNRKQAAVILAGDSN